MLKTPVALFIFNRRELARQVFAEIAKVKPARLLVIADGPREDHPDDAEQCAAARAIVARVDWDCEVLTNYSEVNLGCKVRLASGLDWVFETSQGAIILEDDCLPHPTFFRYCEELLERYAGDERVPMICGSSFHHGRKVTSDSYYFSRFGHIWGWASWRRAWRHYDVGMRRWPELRETSWLLDILGDRTAANYWSSIFDKVLAGEIGTWDCQWFFSWWIQNGLAIVPTVNLVSNVGFGDDATHTRTPVETMAHCPTAEMSFPLRHPNDMVRNRETDLFIFTQICPWARARPSLKDRLRSRLSL